MVREVTPTVAMMTLLPLLRLLDERDPRAAKGVRAALELEGDVLSRCDERVSPTMLIEAFARASEALREAHVGLLLAARDDLRRFRLLEYVIAHAGTGYDALERFARYYCLLNDAVVIRHEVAAERTRVTIAWRGSDPEHPGVRHLHEFLGAMVATRLPRLAPSSRVLAVEYASPRPPRAEELERFFGAPVDFDRPVSAVTISSEGLGARVVAGDRELGTILAQHAEERRARLTSRPRALAEAVRDAIAAEPGARLSLARVARRVGMSGRSLQRGLDDEGTTFAEVAEALRKETALRLLRTPEVTVAEVAFTTGFNEISAFYRAFRRWTGSTPVQYRRRETEMARADKH